MNASPLLGLLLLAFGTAPQDSVLTKPPGPEQGRTPAVETTVAVYDVKDLIPKPVAPAEPRVGGWQRLAYRQGQEPAAKGRSEDGFKHDTASIEIGPNPGLIATKDLAEVAQRFMKPPFEAACEQVTVASEGLIVGNLRAEQHAWLAAFLDLQRHTTGMVEIAITVFEGPRGTFRDAGLRDASTVFEDPAALAEVGSIATSASCR